ncbi:MAG: glycerol kinase GlpK [Eubacteriales bacterium]|nr:glycerol kinase GlpK [Eubacteriales bacterium]
MTTPILLAVDQGTTSSRAVLFDDAGRILSSHSVAFKQHYPQPGWVEHEPEDILRSVTEAIQTAVSLVDNAAANIVAMGITNQRETTLVWEKATGRCVCPAIVWQCRRTASYVEKIEKDGMSETIREKTGLIPDAYFSATKLKYILDTLGLHERAENGELCFGTVDSFLCWHLCENHPHVTDESNASRTMLYNIHLHKWDNELLEYFGIPEKMLPRVVSSAEAVGMLSPMIIGKPIPMCSLAGDQHAALFGQACFDEGMVKNTYGTGCFMLMNTGSECVQSKKKLISTVAWRLSGKTTYAIEGSVFVAGAAIQWLRDEMGLISSAQESEALASSVKDTGGVYCVPSFTGVGAPYWDMYSRGTIIGITRGTGRAHIVRAVLESIAYQSQDLLNAIIEGSGVTPKNMRVDGGASANGFLMQFQADISGIPIVRPQTIETTALGAALFAGYAIGLYPTVDDIRKYVRRDSEFTPKMSEDERSARLRKWHDAVQRSMDWAK